MAFNICGSRVLHIPSSLRRRSSTLLSKVTYATNGVNTTICYFAKVKNRSTKYKFIEKKGLL